MDAATLELSIRHVNGTTYSVDTRFWPPHSSTDARLVRGTLPLLQFDLDALRQLLLDPQSYGKALSAMLFADHRLRDAFAKARTSVETAMVPLRISLRLDANDPSIHSLAWETLHDPERGGFLFRNERVLLSRLLDSPDLTPIAPRPRGSLSALVVVANPTGLEQYRLAPLDVEGEVARCHQALGDIPMRVLAREQSGQAASLSNLQAALRDEPDILYLVAHGTNRDGQSYLWLEQDDGAIARISGNDFARSLADLKRRPLLVVLASCQSAGQSHDDGALAAVGPQLAVAGVSTVLGMQGNVTIDTVAMGMPIFFRELLRDGQIDRALAAARAAVQARLDWWLPVLYTRLRDGQMLHAPAPARVLGFALQMPHQLRPPTADFVGREHEIEGLVQDIHRSATHGAIAIISGMGGIGKTELAYAVANRLNGQFSDAQVVIDLRGSSAALTPGQALQAVLYAFDRESQWPDDLSQLQGVYRSLLCDKRVLILADDAKDAAQIRPLIPPPGCALLVTSRNRFCLAGMTERELTGLPPLQAVELLLTLSPRIGAYAGEIAQSCGQLPLALRVVAGLIKRTTRSVCEYVALLNDERTRLARMRDLTADLDVEASLALSYTALDATAQQVLCQLGVFSASLDRTAAEQVVQVPASANVIELLDWLHDVNLLVYDSAQERYMLHELVRVFALQHLKAADTVQQRYAEYYLQVAVQADRLYQAGGEAALQGLALFDRERPHIDAAWIRSSSLATHTDADRLLVRYATATSNVGRVRFRDEERVRQLEWARDAAERLSDVEALSSILINLGNAYLSVEAIGMAMACYQRAHRIGQSSASPQQWGKILIGLGDAFFLWDGPDQLERAQAYYTTFLDLPADRRDPRDTCMALANLGTIFTRQNAAARAMEYYARALDGARAQREPWIELTVLRLLGDASIAFQQLPKACAYYSASLHQAQQLGDKQGAIAAGRQLARVLADRGYLEQAQQFHRLCQSIEAELAAEHRSWATS